jgi:hypothetical protein
MMNSSTKISFDFATMKWKGITLEQLQLWENLYDNVDIERVLRFDIPQWLDKQVIVCSPGHVKVNKKAQKRNFKMFIVNWLKREQMKALGL